MTTQKKITEMIASIKTIYPYYAKDVDVPTLVKTWTALLKEYPDDLVEAAFYKCLQICKMPPTPADVIERIGTIISALNPSPEQLWSKLVAAIGETGEELGWLQYATLDRDAHIQNIQRIWDNLPEEVKQYVGNKAELRRMAETFSTDDFKFEKARFIKGFSDIKTRVDYIAYFSERDLLENLDVKKLRS